MRIQITIYLAFISINVFGSPQLGDILIIGKDTFQICQLPTGQLKESKQKELYDNIKKETQNFGISLNLWRGFQGVWKLEDGNLFLIELDGIKESPKILKQTFPERYSNNKVSADWFNGDIFIPRGKLLKWDGIFDKTYYKEELLVFKNGKLKKRKIIQNYQDKKRGISRVPTETITDSIFAKLEKLDWEELGEIFCDDDYEVTIGKNGRVKRVRFTPIMEKKWENWIYSIENVKCLITIRKTIKKLKFDKVYWHGKPYEEKFGIMLLYNEEEKRLEMM